MFAILDENNIFFYPVTGPKQEVDDHLRYRPGNLKACFY
jgi:hypothetical protein